MPTVYLQGGLWALVLNMKSKKCSRCGEVKLVKLFYKNKCEKSGLTRWCILCQKIQRMKIRKTLNGSRHRLWASIRDRIRQQERYKKRGLFFTKEEFYNFFDKSNQAKETYQNWVKSGYDSKLTPSVDRINNLRGYSLDNIQIISVNENDKKDKLSKIYLEDIVEIKKLYKKGLSSIKIGKIYNVTSTTILSALKNKYNYQSKNRYKLI